MFTNFAFLTSAEIDTEDSFFWSYSIFVCLFVFFIKYWTSMEIIFSFAPLQLRLVKGRIYASIWNFANMYYAVIHT